MQKHLTNTSGAAAASGRGPTYRWMSVLPQIPQAARESCWRSKSGCGAGEHCQLLLEMQKQGCGKSPHEMLNSTCHSRNTHTDATVSGTTGATKTPPTAAACAALLSPLPRDAPARGQVPRQYTFPGKPLHEATSLPVRPTRECTLPERTPPNALMGESEAGGTKA